MPARAISLWSRATTGTSGSTSTRCSCSQHAPRGLRPSWPGAWPRAAWRWCAARSWAGRCSLRRSPRTSTPSSSTPSRSRPSRTLASTPSAIGFRRRCGRRADGRTIAIVDDVANAGSATRATYAELRDAGGSPVAIGTLLTLGTAVPEFAREHDLHLHSLADDAELTVGAGRVSAVRGRRPDRPGLAALRSEPGHNNSLGLPCAPASRPADRRARFSLPPQRCSAALATAD